MPREKLYRFHLKVAGTYPFPIDMLRYDHCFPRDETDSNAITRTIEQQGRDNKPVGVELLADRPRNWSPNYGRWQSKGWMVVSCTIDTTV